MKDKKGRRNPALKKVVSSPKTIHLIDGKYYFGMGIILLVAFISFLPVIHNSFLNWDDDLYIKDNELIRSLNLKNIFSRFVEGNYHPLTMLVYAIEYHFWGLSETGYHTFNLLLHLANVVLVFYVVFFLSEKPQVALVASLLFAVHPIHVESVAWASELKDLLYAFFFLSSWLCYILYLRKKQKKLFVFSLVLFLLSLFSKAMAVSLPLVLLLTDYLKGRKISIKLFTEKTPFFLLAIIFGVVAIIAQRSFGYIHDAPAYSFSQRIVFASYSVVLYILKILFPLSLCAFYPYPIAEASALPAIYCGYVLLVICFIAFAIYAMRFNKKIAFSTGFFFATIILVLQLIPVGDAVMADRYAYIPSLAIFYLAGEGFNWLWERKKYLGINLKVLIRALLICCALLFSIKTYNQCTIWNNSMSLWNDVINQYKTVAAAYNNRGMLLFGTDKYDDMLNDFNKAIALKPYFAEAYNNRGRLYCMEKKNDEGLRDFNRAIGLKPDLVEAYNNRGNLYISVKKFDDAIHDFDKAINMHPRQAALYRNRGIANFNSGKKEEGCSDFNKALELGDQTGEKLIELYCK